MIIFVHIYVSKYKKRVKHVMARKRLDEPPYAERHVRWCERTGVSHSLLLDCTPSMAYI